MPFASFDIKETVNPALAMITQGERATLAEVVLWSWWQVTPIAQDLRTVIATTSENGAGGDPVVLEMEEGKTGGRLVIWTTAVGSQGWNNLYVVPNFTPLVNETLFHLAAGQDEGQPRQVETGKPLVWTGPPSSLIDIVTVINPDGTSRTIQPELRGDHFFVEDPDTQLPGLYEMRFTAPPKQGAVPPRTAFFSVNIDREELDPAVLSTGELEWFKEHGFLTGVVNNDTLAKAMDASNAAYEYWWAIGLLVLILLVFEVFLTYLHVREQAGMGLKEAGFSGALSEETVAEGNRVKEAVA
jgi:hypothetical protein